MAALTADSNAITGHKGVIVTLPFINGVASETYFLHGVISILAAGKTTPVMAASLDQAGICVEASNGAIGTSDTVAIAINGVWMWAYTSPAIANDGVHLFNVAATASDNPSDCTVTATATNAAVGQILCHNSGITHGWVDLARKALARIA
jgi:hypothetical protein